MELSHKTIHLLHDGDSYEVVIDTLLGTIREIWRYRDNKTSRPEFCRFEQLDDILKDRIHDKLTRFTEDGQACT